MRPVCCFKPTALSAPVGGWKEGGVGERIHDTLLGTISEALAQALGESTWSMGLQLLTDQSRCCCHVRHDVRSHTAFLHPVLTACRPQCRQKSAQWASNMGHGNLIAVPLPGKDPSAGGLSPIW